MSALEADVARLRQVLDRQDGPVIVAGHSYGGQILTALGAKAQNVVGLVYIAAFGLDEGEFIGALCRKVPRAWYLSTWKSTRVASPGCVKMTSLRTSPPMSTQSGRG